MRLSRASAAWIALLTLLFEGLTLLARFGFGSEAASATHLTSALALGLRVHHCYIGAALCALAYRFDDGSWPRAWALRVGPALILSDLVHHFAIMWPLTGNHEFDLFYSQE